MKRKKSQGAQPPDPAKLAPKASAGDLTLHTRVIGVLPIINGIIERLRLKQTLDQFLPTEDRRNKIQTSTALLLLVRNILLSREPIYGLGGWAAAYVPELFGLQERQLKLRVLEEINADKFASKSRDSRDREAELKLDIDVADR